MTALEKYRPDQARDADGRWTADLETAADGFAEAAAPASADAETRRSVRGAGKALITAGYAHAANLASKIQHVVTSTRLASVRPTPGGGISITTTHGLPGSRGHIEATAQIHPTHVMKQPAAARALSIAHRALVLGGQRYAPNRTPPVSATFRNGPQP